MPILNSRIGSGFTSHTRSIPIKRTFKYNLSYLYIDLNEINFLNRFVFFGWNRRSFFSLHDSTYLYPGKEPINQKLDQFMATNAPDISYNSSFLLTSPGFFGINFNPVSFFYFFNNKKLVAIIAEVHNTFKEKHLYLLSDPYFKKENIYFEQIKDFHVSPFFKVEGKYHFLFSKKKDMIDITINYFKGKNHMFNANLKLHLSPIKKYSFITMFVNFISTAALTFPRILFQATKLKFIHKLPHFKNKGIQSNNSFSRKTPSIFSKITIKLVSRHLRKLSVGELILNCPNGDQIRFGNQGIGSSATIEILDYRFFKSLILKGDIGLADAYINQYWSTDNLEKVFDVFLDNESVLRSSNFIIKFKKSIYLLQHKLRNNNISRAKKNIYEHYDLGNDFFKLFLDKHRVYSSGVFAKESDSLEKAQLTKIDKALEMADVKPNHRILEIGSGWGALAIRAVETIGCHVTTVTISEEQYNFVKQKINQHNLDAKIEVKLMDYRLLSGKYDRIVSIEMLEAVGHDYLTTYFKKCYELLNLKGKAMFQCITIPHNRYDIYRKSPDFIQKYIFPGGHLPSLEILKKVTSSTDFNWTKYVNITEHYVTTLRLWEKNFKLNQSNIKALGFDQSFFQTWLYYFNYCSSGFKSNFIENYQFLLEK